MKRHFNYGGETTTTYDIYIDGECSRSFSNVKDAAKAFVGEVRSKLFEMYNNEIIDKYAVEDWSSIFFVGVYNREKDCFESLDLEKEIMEHGTFEYFVDEGPGITFTLKEDKFREFTRELPIDIDTSDDFNFEP